MPRANATVSVFNSTEDHISHVSDENQIPGFTGGVKKNPELTGVSQQSNFSQISNVHSVHKNAHNISAGVLNIAEKLLPEQNDTRIVVSDDSVDFQFVVQPKNKVDNCINMSSQQFEFNIDVRKVVLSDSKDQKVRNRKRER